VPVGGDDPQIVERLPEQLLELRSREIRGSVGWAVRTLPRFDPRHIDISGKALGKRDGP
jgi:hypothetical protein